MYTPASEIAQKRALANALRSQPGPNHTTGSGLAYALDRYMAGKSGYDASQAESQNEQLKAQEMQSLQQMLSNGGMAGPTQDGSQITPRFQHPEVQGTALANALKMAQAQQKADLNASGNSGEYGVSPVWLQSEDGSYAAGQLNKGGGMSMVDVPEGYNVIPDSGRMGYDPRMIGQRGQAETEAEVSNLQQTAQPAAEAAALETTATGEAQTDVELDRQYRMYSQERQQELDEQRTQAFSKNEAKSQQVGMLNGLIDEAREMAGIWTNGFLGTMSEKVPGTPAYNLVAKLDTVRANIGFDRLQEMRDNSVTGGALGQVSEMENRLLQAVWGNLENSQSTEQFLQNLDLVENQVNQSWERINQAYMEDYGEPYFQPENTTDTTDNDGWGIVR